MNITIVHSSGCLETEMGAMNIIDATDETELSNFSKNGKFEGSGIGGHLSVLCHSQEGSSEAIWERFYFP